MPIGSHVQGSRMSPFGQPEHLRVLKVFQSWEVICKPHVNVAVQWDVNISSRPFLKISSAVDQCRDTLSQMQQQELAAGAAHWQAGVPCVCGRSEDATWSSMTTCGDKVRSLSQCNIALGPTCCCFLVDVSKLSAQSHQESLNLIFLSFDQLSGMPRMQSFVHRV